MNRIILLSQKQQNDIANYMPKESTLTKLACFFSIFSDYTRIKILTALCLSEMCVNDISTVLRINQTTVSHQLKFLKNNGAVKSRRCGKVIFYSISNNYVNDIMLDGVDYLLAN